MMERQTTDRSEPDADDGDYLVPKSTRYKYSDLHHQPRCERQNLWLNDDKKARECRSCASSLPTEFGDDEEDDDDYDVNLEEMRYADARMGICSVCRFSLRGNDSDFDKALLCSNGHLLCDGCVERFAIQSDTHCVLCAAVESQQSSSASRTSSVHSVKSKRRCKKSTPAQTDRRRGDASLIASHINIASHYNIGMNYYNNWEDEHEETIDEEVEGKCSQVHNQRSCGEIEKKESNASMKTYINSLSECSRRPIQCPLQNCAMNVAFSALTNHFIFDHPEVPILAVDPGEKSTLIVNFDGLLYDSSHCLALLLLSDKLSGPAAQLFNGSHIPLQYKNRLPLPILVARLHCNASYDNKVHEAGEGGRDDVGDVVIAWVAGLDIGNTMGALRCSIQAIDNFGGEAFRSLTYNGPINSLRTAQKPREVFLTGNCVVLHDGFINHITSGCENLNVNITIY